MTAPYGRGYVEILPNTKEFGTRLRTQVDESISTSTRSLGRLNSSVRESVAHTEEETGGLFTRMKDQVKELAAFALPAIGAVEGFKFIKESISAAREEQKQLAQTGAVLKSTGGAAHVTAAEIEELAKQQSIHTGITQTQIRSNDNLLLTFTNVRNEVGKGNDIFTQATQTVLDMSVALKEDGKAASIQLGKALNDPIKGITALSRVGVTFNAGQKEQIKTLVAHGKTLDAQKIILKELTREFGGSAAAQATSGDKMKASFEAFRVEVGDKLLPIIDKVENFISQHLLPGFMHLMEEAGKGEGVFGAVKNIFKALWAVLVPLVQTVISLAKEAWPKVQAALEQVGPILEKVAGFIKEHGTLIRTLIVGVLAFWAVLKGYKILIAVRDAILAINLAMDTNPIVLLIAAIAALVAGFIYAYNHSKAFRDLIQSIWGFIKRMFDDVWTFLKKWGPLILAVLMPVLGLPLLIWQHWKAIKDFIVTAWNLAFDFIKSIPARLLQYGKDIIQGLWDGLKYSWKALWAWYSAIDNAIIGFFKTALTWLYTAGKWVVQGLWNGLKYSWNLLWRWYSTINDAIINFFRNGLNWLVTAGKHVMQGLYNGLRNIWDNLWHWYTGLNDALVGFFRNAINWLVGAGERIIHGLYNGIHNWWNNVATWLGRMPGRVAHYFTNAITWLKSAGVRIFTGLWNGIKSGFQTIVNWFKDLPGHILSALGIKSPPKWAIEAGKWIIHGLKKGLIGSAGAIKHFFGNLIGEFTSGMAEKIYGKGTAGGIGNIVGGIGNVGRSLTDNIGGSIGAKGGLQEWAQYAALITNTPLSWVPALMRRAIFESGGNPNAINLWDSNAAAGHPSKGLMQTIDSTFANYALPGYGNIYNPIDNMIAAIRYIKSRYGTIFSIDPPVQGYKEGAWEIDANKFAKLHKGEMVIPKEFADTIRGAVGGGDNGMSEAAMTRAFANALASSQMSIDANGLVRFISRQQSVNAVRGLHR